MASARTTFDLGQGAEGSDGKAAGGRSFVWVSLRDPSPEELDAARQEFGLPARVIDYFGMGARRPVLEIVGDLLVAVVKTATWNPAEEAVELGEVQLVLGKDFVVSVNHDGTVLEQARDDLGSDQRLRSAGPAAVLPSVVKHTLGGYGPVLAALNEAVEEVEETVFSQTAPRPTERIYKLSREVLRFRRATVPLTEILDHLATDPPTVAGERLKRRFREERTHLVHLVEGADALGQLLSNVLQANLTEVSVRQNDDMRKISAWVGIWAIPTLVAGIYGMNFEHMPELDWTFGYPLVLLGMVLISGLVYRGFKRSGWL